MVVHHVSCEGRARWDVALQDLDEVLLREDQYCDPLVKKLVPNFKNFVVLQTSTRLNNFRVFSLDFIWIMNHVHCVCTMFA